MIRAIRTQLVVPHLALSHAPLASLVSAEEADQVRLNRVHALQRRALEIKAQLEQLQAGETVHRSGCDWRAIEAGEADRCDCRDEQLADLEIQLNNVDLVLDELGREESSESSEGSDLDEGSPT